MIEQTDAMQLLVDACPSFEDRWKEHIDELGRDVPYVAAGAFARHLLELHNAGETATLTRVCAAIERLHVEGIPAVKEFATIGVLEAIQNVWSHSETSPEEIFPLLGPESQRWWRGLNKFWSGEAPHVGAED